MRNWLRKLLGAASDSSVKSLAGMLGQENGAVVQRLNSIEVIDGVKKKGILGEIATPLERCVVRLTDESAAHTEACKALDERIQAGLDWTVPIEKLLGIEDGIVDEKSSIHQRLQAIEGSQAEGIASDNAILKRLLAVETLLGVAGETDRKLSVVFGRSELGKLQEIYTSLNGKHDLMVAAYAEVRSELNELKAVKDKQNSVRIYERGTGPIHAGRCGVLDNGRSASSGNTVKPPKKPPAKPKKAR